MTRYRSNTALSVQALSKEEFDEHLTKPKHKAMVKTDSSESIDNFLSAMRRYEDFSNSTYKTVE